MGNEAEVFRGLGRVPKVCRYMSGPRIHLFVIFFSFSDTSRVHIRDVSAPYPCPTHIGHMSGKAVAEVEK